MVALHGYVFEWVYVSSRAMSATSPSMITEAVFSRLAFSSHPSAAVSRRLDDEVAGIAIPETYIQLHIYPLKGTLLHLADYVLDHV